MIVRFSVQERTLLQALREVPTTRVVWEDMNITEDGGVVLLFWAESDDFEAFEAAMQNDPTVESPRTVTTFRNRRLYQAEYVGGGRAKRAHSALVETGAIIQECVGTHNGWTLQIAFPSHDALQQYYTIFDESDIQFTPLEKYEQSADRLLDEFGLTAKQEQMLALASDRGYFDVPRKTDLDELADELGISHQAASERLRRAMDILVGRSVGTATASTSEYEH
ncbi:helix-turn-helix domain-containing protein [Halomarina salina]|uniref:Helix-turn-helix domain-containing protein n=1 Tax=Halomarina salina TaxID=1872699 RepID=A0ABD5RJ09_9EURY|nr:helix-turn-helix domain-containing protein [Halomarina salina]